ncbi:F390 synthetase-related protein [Comamonas composti]|uniref:F390 synthetase-related protein n=1 Tax=Comamonas composti TaxID=408558 RepID=UPI0003FF100C|nr:F390 synthetase-related protein [Comamonas composti]
MQLPRMLWTYWKSRHQRFESRAALEVWQQRRLAAFMHQTLVRSPYFKPFVGRPLHAWPMMDKALMMEHFDRMNTAGLLRDELLACAMQAERSRDFSSVVKGFSVGLSSGTSGSRGLFVVSPQERATWAGVMLARMLPRGLFAGERVALFLRANSNLYMAVRSPWLSFEFFDLMQPLSAHLERLNRYAPSIIVGPAQLLRSLALARQQAQMAFAPRKLISCAEVLEPLDKVLLQQVFGAQGELGEVYQATEGFLAATCSQGSLHLNEAHVHIEPEWLDEARFVPVITDFSRITQPVVRYRLDDILVRRAQPCACGSHEMVLERIEGRCDDMLQLPGSDGERIAVLADGLSRALAQALPLTADYRLVQIAEAELELFVQAEAAQLPLFRAQLEDYLHRQGVVTGLLRWRLHDTLPPAAPDAKRRRILRRWRAAEVACR